LPLFQIGKRKIITEVVMTKDFALKIWDIKIFFKKSCKTNLGKFNFAK